MTTFATITLANNVLTLITDCDNEYQWDCYGESNVKSALESIDSMYYFMEQEHGTDHSAIMSIVRDAQAQLEAEQEYENEILALLADIEDF